ncbi:hypothetical protein E5161_16060 [Cohnella pontilimi]|uniref:BIG2 domain-containing protein n=1 Tax=Cohnella pontilimi TaxID=2564100 RepID=A0A4V5LS05_9BACL|nr:Ig-like domain-containing protein [Cohnella pontilimi]TJY40669.1 hypothetical protein E5161_16060 [Cohnella pontilimi]
MSATKPRSLRRILSVTLSAALTVSACMTGVTGFAGTVRAASGFVPPQAVLDHLHKDDWGELRNILSGIYGTITTPLKITDVNSGKYTMGQLVGNGDIGAIAAGISTTSQQFYFAKQDFWGTLHAQSNAVKDNQGILSGGGLSIGPTGAAGSKAASVFNMKQDLLNAQVITTLQLKDTAGSDATITMNSWTADTDNVFVTEITNEGTSPVTLSAKQWVPAMAYASGSATDLTDAQSTYPYTGGIDSKGNNPVLWTTRDTNAGANGNTSNFRSRMATATTVVGSQLENARQKIEATDYYDSNKGKYYNSLGEAGDFTVNAGSKVYVLSYFASSSGPYNAIKSVSQVQADAVSGIASYTTEEAINRLKQEHSDWWKNYWLKSYVQFNDADLNQYYYGSLYVLGSSNRPTSANGKVNKYNLPASMYGPWIPADNMGWGGRYFLNYNQQAHYYASGSTNRIETAVPYNRVIAYDKPWQINNAAAQGHDGAVHVRTLSPFHLMASAQPALNPKTSTKVYGFNASSTDQKSNGMFAVVPMVFYYEYTLDEEYLRNVLYPYLKELMKFYDSYVLRQDDGNGLYHYSVIGSSIHEGDAADINPDLDIGAIKFLSNFLSLHAFKMNEDPASLTRWKDIADHTSFPEAMLPKGIFNAANTDNYVPTLLAVDYMSPNQAHVDLIEPGDQPVELEGVVFPFENAQLLDGDPELLQKVRNTLEYMNGWAAGSFAGWSSQNNGFPKVYPIAARAGWPAADLLAKFRIALNAKVRTSNLTYYGSGGAIETVASMEALNSMLMQSSTTPELPTTVWAFPNWDKSRSVTYERLGAMGNVEISSAYDAQTQNVPYVDLKSKRNGKIALVNPWTQGTPVIREVSADGTLGADVSYEIRAGKIIFDARQNTRYMVMNDSSDPAVHTSGITLNRYSADLILGGTGETNTIAVQATVEGNPGDTVTWSSSDPAVASVTANGATATVTAVGTGSGKVAQATITAASAQDPGIKRTFKVRVADVSTVPTSLTLISPSTATIYGPASTGASTAKVTGTNRLQLTAAIQPSNVFDKRIMWKSSNNNVAMVDKNGLVIARGAGTATITGTSMANPALPPVTTTVTVTAAGVDYSNEGNLAAVLENAKAISIYSGNKTSSGGFRRVSSSPDWEGKQEIFQMAHINALGVKDKYSGYSTVNISRDTAYFAAVALNEAIRVIDPSKAIELNGIDKTSLAAAIQSASKLTDSNFDTEQQWNELQAALAAAISVNDNAEATQEEVDAALTALQAAMAKAKISVSAGRVPVVDISAGTASIYGSHLVQFLASGVAARTWTVTNPDGSATADAKIDSTGLLYATAEETYLITSTPAGGEAETVSVTVSNLAAMPNLASSTTGFGTYFGSTSGGSYPPKNAFDGNASTFYDHSATVPYVGWDFGKPAAMNMLRFLPRSGTNAARIYQAKLQGSNESPTAGYVDLVTITDQPSTANASSWYVKALNNTTAYRYYRWLGTNGSHANIAEMELYINVDKTDLAETITAAEALIEEKYTPDSWAALQSAVQRAAAVNEDPNAPQERIDSAEQAVKTAVANLVPDTEAPVTRAETDPAYTDGWFRSPVTVTLTAEDDVSGIAMTEYKLSADAEWQTYESPVVLSEDGIYELFYRSTDRAGNEESAKSLTVRIDQTPASFELTVNGAPFADQAVFTDDKIISFELTAVDATSGAADKQMFLDGKPYTGGSAVDLAGKLGKHELRVVVRDEAGNVTDRTISFEVKTEIGSLKKLIERYIASGDITGMFAAKLTEILDKALSLLQKGEVNDALEVLPQVMQHINHNPKQVTVSEKAKAVIEKDLDTIMRSLSKK